MAFAEVEQFIDTPIKRYSSGMYVLLAFAVAAHRSTTLTASLEPEILLVDKVPPAPTVAGALCWAGLSLIVGWRIFARQSDEFAYRL